MLSLNLRTIPLIFSVAFYLMSSGFDVLFDKIQCSWVYALIGKL